MLIFSNNDCKLHNPKYEIFNGERTPHSETSARLKNIECVLHKKGYLINNQIDSISNKLLNDVHSSEYVLFLKNTCKHLNNKKFLYPSVFNMKSGRIGRDITAQMGAWSFDMYTPLSNYTFHSAFCSASLAYTTAKHIASGKYNVGYALCRPPGHHATSNLMGGYCYLNNSAIAAHYLSQKGKVAILDIDLHHGNGTQEIFYSRSDVLTVSIHADPRYKFPYYSGYENEKGEGNGKGYNYNFPLPKNTNNVRYQRVLIKTLKIISDYHPQYLIVPLGLDTYEKDPIGFFKLTTEYYNKIAKQIKKLNIPTVIVQEGGYNSKELGSNVLSFLTGFE